MKLKLFIGWFESEKWGELEEIFVDNSDERLR